ncbi:MAG: hypothetical protein LCI00_24125 [Chloroflexi bacterium]|nr:hypothetical protein [Chloroflexota bacterium]
MPLKLNKLVFARNRDREKEFGDIFNKTSRGLSYIMALSITVFFTPALIATSFLSKEAIVILANLSLSLGYLTNFAYRIYKKEVSKAELMVSSLTLAGFVVVSYLLSPTITALPLIKVLIFIHQMATAVNLFFLIKHVIVPPCKKLIENIAQTFGFDIAGRYYSKPPLTLEQDRYIIDILLMKAYGHNSYSPDFDKKELVSFNKLLEKLSEYIDKYDETILGYINNKDDIADLEKQIAQLTTKGNTDSSYAFIKKKIGFKTTKISMLQEARDIVRLAFNDPHSDATHALHFFKGIDDEQLKVGRHKVLGDGLQSLEKEIQRQKDKIASLQECLPIPRPKI